MSSIHNQIWDTENLMPAHYFTISICTQILDKRHLPTSEIKVDLEGKEHFISPLDLHFSTCNCPYIYKYTIKQVKCKVQARILDQNQLGFSLSVVLM